MNILPLACLLPSYSVEILSHGIWKSLGSLQDPELRRLAQVLPDTVIQSRVPSTAVKYAGALRRWSSCSVERYEVPVLLVRDIHLVLYLQHLSEVKSVKQQSKRQSLPFHWCIR